MYFVDACIPHSEKKTTFLRWIFYYSCEREREPGNLKTSVDRCQ